jgi:hypothetical protein
MVFGLKKWNWKLWPNGADCEMTIDSNDFVKLLKGELRASSLIYINLYSVFKHNIE